MFFYCYDLLVEICTFNCLPLIGMTKGLVIRLIAFENILLFVGAVAIGMVAGLLSSRLFAMILSAF